MWEDNRGLTFSLDSYELYFGQKQWFKLKHPSNDWLQTHSFSFHKMLIDGLELCRLLVD